jgi:hypothetical protein
VTGKSICQGGMEEAPENGKESSHSTHATGIERNRRFITVFKMSPSFVLFLSHYNPVGLDP